MTAAPEYDDVGLNLVFNDPSSTDLAGFGGENTNGQAGGGGGGGKKNKRKTKYDRRREKGRLAKLAKTEESGGADAVSATTATAASVDAPKDASASVLKEPTTEVKSNNNDAPKATDATNSQDDISVNDEKESTTASVVTPNSDKLDTSAENNSTTKSENTDGMITAIRPKESNDEHEVNKSSAPAQPSIAPSTLDNLSEETLSRRYRPQIPITEEQKSRYLSEFHARPRDMDRSERASNKIKPSLASNHIFSMGDDDNDDDRGDDNNGHGANIADNAGTNSTSDETGRKNDSVDKDGNDIPKDGPFQKLGLHPNLVSTLTSSTGYFQLSQPTNVQCRAISSLLRDGNGSGGNQTKRKKKVMGKLEENLFIQSETGSGKTLAYLLPILQHLAVDHRTQALKKVDRQLGGTRAIILTPTRELATQTYSIATNLCSKSFPWIVPGCFSGGEKRKSEKARLRKGISILIATPGRLLDHVCKTESLLSALKGKLEWLVLDEADRLLDAGLGGQVEQIVQHLRSNQPGAGPRRDGVSWRAVLVSATVNGELEGLAKTVLGGEGWMWARGHGKVERTSKETLKSDGQSSLEKDVSSPAETHHELDNSAPHQLAQLYMMVSAKLRLSSLVAFLAARASKGERTVVFLATCDSVDYHHALFTAMESILPIDENNETESKDSKGIFGKHCPIYKLHGDIHHSQRMSIMKDFSGDSNKQKSSKHHSAILLATDVAARGLNFPSLDWIVQYDPPCETKDYVHRAGRSARAGQAGHALLFLLPSERQYIEVLQLRGMKEISALSLSSTLNSAAVLCQGVTQEGEAKAPGSKYSDGNGEAFTVAIQNRLEQCVIQNDTDYKAAVEKMVKDPKQRRKSKRDAVGPLLEGARLAFSAFVRAYPAKEKAVRHIFNARALHLGHIARSLALKETPKMVSKGNSNNSSRHENSKGKEASSSKESKGEKRNSRLAFGATKNEDKSVMTTEDTENERNMSLLGDALGETRMAKPSNKKMKTSTPADAKHRMMKAAERLTNQDMEFM